MDSAEPYPLARMKGRYEAMKFKCRWAIFTATLLLCLICAHSADDLPRPGKSTKNEVRAKLGAPTAIRRSAGGEEVWEYAAKPTPYQTHFLTFAKDGMLRDIKQVINDENFSNIKAGSSTQADVTALLGTPWRTTNYGDCHPVDYQEVWEYRGRDSAGIYTLHIEFDEAGVARLMTKTPEQGRPMVLAAAPSRNEEHPH